METKKAQQITTVGSQKDSAVSKLQTQDFIGDVKAEIKKIHWTSYEELIVYTKIVVGATFFFGMGIYFMDLIIQASLSVIEYGLRLITG